MNIPDEKDLFQMKRGAIRWRRLIGLLVLLGLFVIGGLVAVIMLSSSARGLLGELFWQNDREVAAQITRDMVSYTLPAGFQEQQAMNVQDVRAVIIAPTNTDDSRWIVLQQGAPGLNDPEYRQQVEESWARAIGSRRYETHLVETQTVIIKGEPATLSIREGVDDQGQMIRQVTTVFRGNMGAVLLIIVGPLKTWDMALVEQFIGSLE